VSQNQREAGSGYAKLDERTPVTEDSERRKTWDESLDLSCSVPVGQWLPSDRRLASEVGRRRVAGRLEKRAASSTSAQPRLPIRLHTSSQNGSRPFVAR